MIVLMSVLLYFDKLAISFSIFTAYSFGRGNPEVWAYRNVYS